MFCVCAPGKDVGQAQDGVHSIKAVYNCGGRELNMRWNTGIRRGTLLSRSRIALGAALTLSAGIVGCGGGGGVAGTSATSSTSKAAIQGVVQAPLSQVSGRAAGRADDPNVVVSGAKVELIDLDSTDPNGTKVGETTSDKDGKYSFATVTDGKNYQVKASKDVTGGKTLTLSAVFTPNSDSSTADTKTTCNLDPITTVVATTVVQQQQALKSAVQSDGGQTTHTDLQALAKDLETKRRQDNTPPPDCTDSNAVQQAATTLKSAAAPDGSYYGLAVTVSGGSTNSTDDGTNKLAALVDKQGRIFMMALPNKTGASTGTGSGTTTGQTITVTGTLVDGTQTASPVAGAIISVPGTTLQTETDASGKFTLANVPADQTQISILRPTNSTFMNAVGFAGKVYFMEKSGLPFPTPDANGISDLGQIILYAKDTLPQDAQNNSGSSGGSSGGNTGNNNKSSDDAGGDFATGQIDANGVLDTKTKNGNIHIRGVFTSGVGIGTWISTDGSRGTWELKALPKDSFAGLYAGKYTSPDGKPGDFAMLVLADKSVILVGGKGSDQGMSFQATGTVDDTGKVSITFDGHGETITIAAQITGDSLTGTWTGSTGDNGQISASRAKPDTSAQ